jgi:hypothetical protein
LNRRQFLGTSAAGGAMLAAGLSANTLMAAQGGDWPKMPPSKIYTVYAGRTGDSYLTHPTDELAKFKKYFADLEKKVGDVQFVGGDMVPPTNGAVR